MALFTFECDDFPRMERFVRSLRKSFPLANIESDGFKATLETSDEHAGNKVDHVLDRHRRVILTEEE